MKKSTLFAVLSVATLSAAAEVKDLPSNPPTTMIENPMPGVERTTLVKSGLGFYRTGNSLDAILSDGSLTRMVREGDKLYLGRIFSWCDVPGWIEGTVESTEEEGEVVTFKFPQLINTYQVDNGVVEVHNFYAVVCEQKTIALGQADMIPTKAQEMKFTLQADGSLLPVNPKLFLGNWEYADYAWEWNYDGDFYDALTLQEETALTLPSEVEMKPMVLTYPHILYGGTYADEVKVGFKDDECYISGIALGISDLSDATIKGTVGDNNVVTFYSNQFLGDSWLFGFTQYFLAGETSFVDDPSMITGTRPEFDPLDLIEFVYDPEKGTLTSDMSFIIVPSLQEDRENLYYQNIYNYPSIFPAGSGAVTALVEPELVSYFPADSEFDAMIMFAASMVSADGQLLDMSKLYFQIYTDGEVLEFTPAMDPELKAPVSMVPFGSNDYECFVAQEEVVQMVNLPGVDFESLSLRLVYDPEGENPVYSDFVTVAGSGVEGVAAEEGFAPAGYLDLNGSSIRNLEKGICIRVMKNAEGAVRYEKVVVK